MDVKKMRAPKSVCALALSLLLASAQLCPAIDIGDGRFASKTNGKEELFTDQPGKLILSFAANDENVNMEKTNLVFGVINTMSFIAGGQLELAQKVSGQFIGIMLDDRPFTENGFVGSLSNLNDPLVLRSLERDYKKGSSCVSSAIYSTEGVFQRAAMFAKEDAPSDELFACALELSAHVYGVTTYSSYIKMTIEQKLRYVIAMLSAKNSCLRELNAAAQCGYNKIEEME